MIFKPEDFNVHEAHVEWDAIELHATRCMLQVERGDMHVTGYEL